MGRALGDQIRYAPCISCTEHLATLAAGSCVRGDRFTKRPPFRDSREARQSVGPIAFDDVRSATGQNSSFTGFQIPRLPRAPSCRAAAGSVRGARGPGNLESWKPASVRPRGGPQWVSGASVTRRIPGAPRVARRGAVAGRAWVPPWGATTGRLGGLRWRQRAGRQDGAEGPPPPSLNQHSMTIRVDRGKHADCPFVSVDRTISIRNGMGDRVLPRKRGLIT
jgi:hypothetical protein